MSPQPKLHLLFHRDEINTAVRKLAAEIKQDYHHKSPLLIGILKGSFMFMADLIRYLDFPLEVDFIRLSSYGSSRESSGKVKAVQGLRSSIKGRHTLIIEDIVDTGATTAFLMDYLREEEACLIEALYSD